VEGGSALGLAALGLAALGLAALGLAAGGIGWAGMTEDTTGAAVTAGAARDRWYFMTPAPATAMTSAAATAGIATSALRLGGGFAVPVSMGFTVPLHALPVWIGMSGAVMAWRASGGLEIGRSATALPPTT
jgi:hypothetical protein